MKSILVIAAHPDDETLGCGGTMARLAQEGKAVHVAYVADGVGSRIPTGLPDQQALAARRLAAANACTVLGAQLPRFGDYPDNRLDSVPLLEVVQYIEALICDHRPDTIFTHHCGDLNIDHQLVHKAVGTACRPQAGHPVTTLLFFETPSSTEWQTPGDAPAFTPNWFVDITDTLDLKIQAAQCYESELRPWPHPRSVQGIEHLARWRGATVGVDATEAFMLGRYRT
ncbi:N-acetylglucosaminyl deacetylase, LmbE family [Desulfonatronum thiosulfatophilum]|uniref:N-acetylglucosaminyl deacetylase, LmbE family n=1 Tax=Desulfonatronum thiosulfatophilum TaxID=617002 RepID=A0A1G6DV52_9BACT|nr:PIG-L deacetylase family protein [Desulfonatronum thiosulfatophilum]SDB49033.1 N-acetylglucosaminyl deacetylase, LmbE family [Desulfonatronum thiosulfatophilum]